MIWFISIGLKSEKKLFQAGKQDNFLFIMDYVLRKKLVVMKIYSAYT